MKKGFVSALAVLVLLISLCFTACEDGGVDPNTSEIETAKIETTKNNVKNETTKGSDDSETAQPNFGSKGLAYQPLSGGTCYISGIGNCTDSYISIPMYIDGHKVTGIGDKAFYNCKSIKSITIPDSVTSIGNYAFYKCVSLVSITVPKSVTSLGAQAFAYCESLASITIPASITSLEYNTFLGCFKLVSVTIPKSVTFIDAGVLSSNSIESIHFSGTKAQWNAITIYDYYYSFRDFTIYCTDGNIIPE